MLCNNSLEKRFIGSWFLGDLSMQAADFFRSRIDAMINVNDPAVLVSRLPWGQIETAVAQKFERQHRAGQILESQDVRRHPGLGGRGVQPCRTPQAAHSPDGQVAVPQAQF